jgi:predicted dithiol-disulfide oxidoreductase (DUF899 family)
MQHAIVSQNEWLAARKSLLAKEKDFSKARDALSEARRALPWLKINKNYVFGGPNGKESLSDLFAAKANSSSITSCSVPAGRKAARAAHSSPIISTGR